ncbi:MAG: hypothetical protein HYX61_02915 [Gammaproteobacteria bacterium]|jgi:hypothetical protein|nr:hypothetical protein [Gammaproteobacteria bacterium]
MWHINSEKLYELRSADGLKFAGFGDILLHAHAKALSIPLSSLYTGLRNISDGGVDTKVDQGTSDDNTGWMKEPSIWQYKARDFSDIHPQMLKEEVNKPYVVQLIKEGYAYRFCICDILVAQKVGEWENVLNEEIQKICPGAAKALVLTNEDLARWLLSYPAITLQFFYSSFNTQIIDLNRQLKAARYAIQTYVPYDEWSETAGKILEHINFDVPQPNVVLPITGKAGVGKTRMVLETLFQDKMARSLTVYSTDEKELLKLSHFLTTDETAQAIIVADDCSVKGGSDYSQLLNPHAKRIRVITVSNQNAKRPTIDSQFSLVAMSAEQVLEVLGINFPEVAESRRRLYAQQSEGFIRFAGALCKSDPEIQALGLISPSREIYAYYEILLKEHDSRAVVESLSLFDAVGFTEEDSKQLDFVLSLSGISKPNFLRIANNIHDSIGFVGRNARYFYVTPYIIIKVAFFHAWQGWIEHDPDTFFKSIPPQLIESFIKNVTEHGTKENKKMVTSFFHQRAEQLLPGSLAQLKDVMFIIAVVESDPDGMLSVLRRKIEQATDEEVMAIKGDWANGDWGPRRKLVWLLERLATFKEYFYDCEISLLKLALNESEPNIANNSRELWKELYRIVLSGTSIPFLERFTLLEKYLQSKDEKIVELALSALEETLNVTVSKAVPPETVAGRITPPSWVPASSEEYSQCFSHIIKTAVKLATSHAKLKDKIGSALLNSVRSLLSMGYLNDLQLIFDKQVNETLLVHLDEALADFIYFDNDGIDKNYMQQVKDWKVALKPTDFHGRLVNAVAKNSWDLTIRDEEAQWNEELKQLANELVTDNNLLSTELEWLCSEVAHSSASLGWHIGKKDPNAKLIKIILDACQRYKNPLLGRGYIQGLLELNQDHAIVINSLLDQITSSMPAMVYDLAIVGGNKLNLLERTFNLIEKGQLTLNALSPFAFGSLKDTTEDKDLKRILCLLIESANTDNQNVFSIFDYFLGSRYQSKWSEETVEQLSKDPVLPEAWKLLKLIAEVANPREVGFGFWWGKVVEDFIEVDSKQAISIAVQALLSKHYGLKKAAQEVLISTIQTHADLFLECLEPILADEQQRLNFEYGTYHKLIRSIPESNLEKWITKQGLEAARLVASFLPLPYVNSDDEAIVPSITAFVLEKFETDNKVFEFFSYGAHRMQVYSGDIAKSHQEQANVAARFLNNPIKRIREWAEIEQRNSLAMVERYQRRS